MYVSRLQAASMLAITTMAIEIGLKYDQAPTSTWKVVHTILGLPGDQVLMIIMMLMKVMKVIGNKTTVN